jgi:transcription elongation factor GreB
MNKAFVKEDDSGFDPGPELHPDARADIPAGAKNYMTPNGAHRLRSELDELVNRQRPQLLEQINRIDPQDTGSAAETLRSAKKALRKTGARIDYLAQRLELTEIVDPLEVKSDHVQFGATVSILHEDDSVKKYQIVGIDEADIGLGRISWASPLAKALLDAKAGDVFTFKTPVREEELEVISVVYK